ncbi:MAG: flagellar hook-basal body complex protein [Candidatus Margulisbacteria bacterium]|nr:flagellar hook-basal body complex protein [Candidatus Margulisiibacteriota bacterium]
MLRSMFSGLSGLRNHQIGLDVIGNNISNVNTVGYKSSRIQFNDLLSQTIRGASTPIDSGRGGTNPIQVGLGVGTSAIDVSHSQGNLQSTGTMSDLAIQGNGFFILSDGSNTTFTRAGSFSFDANGTMVHANGMKVMGWQATSTGEIDRNSSISGITIPVGQTINANASTKIQYAHNLDSTSDMLGTPKLAAGNSANVERVYGKYSGSTTAMDETNTTPFPITDVVGTHYVSVQAETHLGERNSLNGTETLSALGVTDLSTFKVVVNGVAHGITLSNGVNSSVNELISAINSQVTGVTAELSNNAVKISQNVAGLSSNVYVEDDDLTTNGIAANVFGTGNGKWAAHAKTVGAKTGLALTDTLTGLDNTNDLVVTVNGANQTFDLSAAGVTGATTVTGLITAFNTWSQAQYGTGANAVFMGLNKSGKLYIGDNSHDTAGYVKIADNDNPASHDGIADLFFSNVGNWSTDKSELGKTSTAASVTHYFQEEDGGGTHKVDLSFSNGDATITGLDGINIIAQTDGFKTGSFVVNTVQATDHTVSTSVYDSLGNEHTVTLTLNRTANNTWTWTASGVDTTGSGTLTFDSNGTIQSGANSGTISVGAQGGASSLSITPDFTEVTQYADPSTMVHIKQDGYPNGALSTYSIDSNGEILGIYTNGLNQKLGQLAVAAFNNPGGLLKVSDSMFISSNNSGAAQVGAANTGGRGSLSAGTLEMSNVDVAQEFANMIIYERGFQANSKVITTGDDMLQTLVNMKR